MTGLDTYFFLNLAVGQPSNNMDLSEIEICLGIIMIFSFGICIIRKENKYLGEHIYVFFFFISGFTVPEARCRMRNHQCSCLEVVLFTSIIRFYVNYQEYISNR